MLRRQQRAKVGAAFNELMYGARELAFRAEEEALRLGDQHLLMESPFEAAESDREQTYSADRRPLSSTSDGWRIVVHVHMISAQPELGSLWLPWYVDRSPAGATRDRSGASSCRALGSW